MRGWGQKLGEALVVVRYTVTIKKKKKIIFVLNGIFAKIELRHEKTGFCICENKDADQLHGNCKADQRLCFRYTDSTIPLLP